MCAGRERAKDSGGDFVILTDYGKRARERGENLLLIHSARARCIFIKDNGISIRFI